MPMVFAEQSGGSGNSKFIKVDIPSNIYEATLTKLETGEEPDFNDKTVMKPTVYWYFTIQGKQSSIELLARSSTIWSSGKGSAKQSKMYKWSEAILGEDPGYSFDIENLIGKRCRIVVERKANKAGTEYYATIKDVMGMPQEDAELPF